jgi:hypothetical protein
MIDTTPMTQNFGAPRVFATHHTEAPEPGRRFGPAGSQDTAHKTGRDFFRRPWWSGTGTSRANFERPDVAAGLRLETHPQRDGARARREPCNEIRLHDE